MVDVPDKVQQAQAERSSVGAHRRVSRGIRAGDPAKRQRDSGVARRPNISPGNVSTFFSRSSMYSLYSDPGRTPSLSEDDQTADEFVCWLSRESSYVRQAARLEVSFPGCSGLLATRGLCQHK